MRNPKVALEWKPIAQFFGTVFVAALGILYLIQRIILAVFP